MVDKLNKFSERKPRLLRKSLLKLNVKPVKEKEFCPLKDVKQSYSWMLLKSKSKRSPRKTLLGARDLPKFNFILISFLLTFPSKKNLILYDRLKRRSATSTKRGKYFEFKPKFQYSHNGRLG